MKDKNSGVPDGLLVTACTRTTIRAKLMRETCHEVLGELGLWNDPLFKLAMELERSRWKTNTSSPRKLYPNVDFYSGIVQRAIGIPVSPVHRHLRAGPHGGLDCPAERDDRRP